MEEISFSLYGLFISLYFIFQIVLCLCNRNTMRNASIAHPTVALLVVGYREDRTYWKNCLESIKEQDYPLSRVLISIDGNEEEDLYMKEISDNMLSDCVSYSVLMNLHGGKREAIASGLRYLRSLECTPEYIVFVDSDTVLCPNSVRELVNCIDKNPKNGCATGCLLIFDEHFLGKIINARYASAFNLERASLSFFGVMNCCSGPLSIYRSCVIDEAFIEEFVNQTYCGIKCGPGDDRHLTNMFLIRGWRSLQTHKAIAYTEAPKSFLRFIKQQTRWMRSFFREQFWQIKAIGEQNAFLAIVTQYELLYPIFVLLWFLSIITNSSMILLIKVSLLVISVVCVRTVLLILFMRDMSMVYNIFYLPLFMFFLLPLKIYCLATCYKMNWITSTRLNLINKIDCELIIISSMMLLWNASIVYSIYNKLDNYLIIESIQKLIRLLHHISLP